MRYLIGLVLLGLCGCSAFGGRDPNIKYPIIQTPQRPELHIIKESELSGLSDDVIKKLIENDDRLKMYLKKLEVAIDEYNRWASGENH